MSEDKELPKGLWEKDAEMEWIGKESIFYKSGNGKDLIFYKTFSICFLNWLSFSRIDLWFLKMKTFSSFLEKMQSNGIFFQENLCLFLINESDAIIYKPSKQAQPVGPLKDPKELRE